jgi:hypothetical protein
MLKGLILIIIFYLLVQLLLYLEVISNILNESKRPADHCLPVNLKTISMTRPANLQRLDRNNWIVYGVLFLSLCYFALLVSFIHNGVFYSADGGVKSIAIRQLTKGYGFKYLHLDQPSWVQSIWQDGFFPFRPPFFYPSTDGYMFVFPPAFQVINSFFYSMLGYAGLYILPVSSMLLLWVCTILLLKRCGISPSGIALALFVLVFCSPLTVYGTMYWEHAPAVLLLFAGLAFIARTPTRLPAAVMLGLVSGLAIWLRPEAILMNFLYALAAIVLYAREKRPVYIAFVSCLFISVLCFFAFNKAEYGSILGLHSQQVVNSDDPETRMTAGHVLHNLVMNNYRSIRYFFFILLLLPVVYRLFTSPKDRDPRPGLLAAIVFGFSLIAPFIVPNEGGRQWGARYFLPLIPITVVALCLAYKQWDHFTAWLKPVWLTVIILCCFGYSFMHNTYKGGIKEMRWAYTQRVKPSLDTITAKPGNVVVVFAPYMAYELGSAFSKEYFFLAPGDDSLRKLLPLLKRQGIHEYTYISDPRDSNSWSVLHRDSATIRQMEAAIRENKVKDEFLLTKFTIE